MKVHLEEIISVAGSSLNILVNPNLSDFFFWHFHPEYELVLIEGTNGNRHVGEHNSTFQNRDLVFIGANIPHLNFDYGVKGYYEKIVLHLKPDFLKSAFSAIPELGAIQGLFEKSQHGVSFGGATMDQVGQRLKKLPDLNEFDRLMEVLQIFQILAHAPDQNLLHAHPVQNPHGKREKKRLNQIYQFIDANYQRKITLSEVADLSNLTKEAFCRYFKKMTKLTFTAFVNHYRIDVAKKLLQQGNQITETCFQCGFESISYFNRVFKNTTGTNPMAFKMEYLSPS